MAGAGAGWGAYPGVWTMCRMTAPSLPALGAGHQRLSKNKLWLATAHLLTGAGCWHGGGAHLSLPPVSLSSSSYHLASFSLAFFCNVGVLHYCDSTPPHIYYSLASVDIYIIS